MRGLVLSLLMVGSVGFQAEAMAEQLCLPGPAISCIDMNFIRWTEGGLGTDWAGDYRAYEGEFNGMAIFDPSHVMIAVSFEQVLTGSSVLCTSAANPENIISGPGPATCSLVFQVHQSWVEESGEWNNHRSIPFYTGTTLKSRGPVGTPEDLPEPPKILGLAAFELGEDGPEGPVAVCGGGFFGPWAEIGGGRSCISGGAVVPEPTTVLLLGTGLLGLGFVAWRKKEDE